MRILSKRQVKELVLYSPQHTARLEKGGLFPKRVQLGPNRVGCGHTMRNYQDAFYEPKLSDSENVESWEEGGSHDMRKRAHGRWTQMLKEYETPPMEQTTREELEAFVAKRKEELPDAWY